MSLKLELKGQRFGLLVVVKDHGKEHLTGGKIRILRECLCDCGRTTYAPSDALINGVKISCGCERLRRSIESRATHRQTFGGHASGEYSIYQGMKDRCYNPHNKAYKNYGGRGIYICERWRRGFLFFLEDMGPRPSPKYSIDRIDNNGPYSPENCRWATKSQQSRNQRVTRVTIFQGIVVPVCELAENNGIGTLTFCYHLDKGRTADQILEFLKRKHFGEKIKWKKFILACS